MIDESVLNQGIQEEFNFAFESMISKDISAVANAIDEKIFHLIEGVMLNHTKEFINGSHYIEDPIDRKIEVDNEVYTLKMQEPWDRPNTIILAYIKLYTPDRKYENPNLRSIAIEGIGKYKEIELVAPTNLRVNFDQLLPIIETIFKTSYGWLFHKLRNVMRGSHIVTSQLYTRIKISLSNRKDIYNSLWFVVQHNNQCIILLDSENVEAALNNISNNVIHPDISPYQLLDEFINMRLPFDQAFAQQALKEGQCINGVINQGKYAEDHPLLAIGQIQIFSPEVSVFPIITEGRNHLYASFPTKYRGELEPLIELNKESIIRDFKSFDSRIIKMIKSLKNHRMDVTRIAEFLGAFAASYTNSLLKS